MSMQEETAFDFSAMSEMEEDIFRDFLDETLEQLNGIDNLLIRLEQEPGNLALVNEIFRPVHSLKGNSAFFGLLKVKKLAHEAENILDAIRKNSLLPRPDVLRVLLRAINELRGMLQRVQARKAEVEQQEALDALLDELAGALVRKAGAVEPLWESLVGTLDVLRRRLAPEDKPLISDLEDIIARLRAGDSLVAEAPDAGPPSSNQDELTPPETTAEEVETSGEVRKTMRVPERYIDDFLSFVGELIVVGEMFNHLRTRLAVPGADIRRLTLDFQRANETFSTLSNALQKSIMNIRMVPARSLLNKVPRLARDTSARCGKEVIVRIEGGEIEMDKSILEQLDSPLTHLVRNAVDHGIEAPARREASGKSRHGNLLVRVSEADTCYQVDVEDDGAGLDLDRIGEKARQAGFIPPGRELSKQELLDCICRSGFSTAASVSEISGRGVGLDVVRSALEQAGGGIDIETTRGRGTSFHMKLKKGVTTRIMRGFLVEVDGQVLVFPLDRVRETVSLERKDLQSVAGKGLCIQRHGRVLPIVDVRALLGGDSGPVCAGDALLVVVVEAARQERALLISDVLGVQQMVLKDILGLDFDRSIIEGGALLGDGRVALVVNPDALCG